VSCDVVGGRIIIGIRYDMPPRNQERLSFARRRIVIPDVVGGKREERMNQINIQLYETEVGQVVLGSFRGKLCFLGFRDRGMKTTVDDRIKKVLNAEIVERDDEILEKTRRQLDEYLEGRRKAFDVPVLMTGTDFQKRVWKALMRIPYGATSTYGQIAKAIGNPRAVRAVGGACGANPIAIIVPCHRVVGSNGGLVGYGGGLPLKRRLLALEQKSRPNLH
jgi:methylated-DNA-[protein]-cysteine S-methyltransferase